jgi:CzcA family heavy metal efflux pump
VNGIIAWSIRYRGLVCVLAAVWLAAGALLLQQTPFDVLPEFVPPQVEIQTEAPGLSPEQVEQIVTRPVEQAINGTQGLETLRSESIFGLSVVSVTFEDGADPYRVRQGISERLAVLTGTLPPGVASPTVSPLTSSTMDVLKIGLVSDTVDPFGLRDVAEWTLRPRLLAVPGIARVNVFGGAVRQIHVEPDLEKLAALGLSMNDVAAAARQALQVRGLGYIDLHSQRITIATPSPQPDPQKLAQALVTTVNDVPVRLGDLAKVTIAPALAFGDAVVQGRQGVLLTISGQYGASTLEATHRLEDVLADMIPVLEQRGIKVYPALHRPATFLERALGNIEQALALGALLILAVLLIVLRSIRAAAISFLAIPLSLVSAVAVLKLSGQSINTLSLGGFAVALGVLVDDAIIDIENIIRRLRTEPLATRERRLEIVREASIEIRGSMFYGTLAVMLVFIPVAFASGVQGKFLWPLAAAFLLAVGASLLVAVTVTPALCAIMLARLKFPEPRWLMRFKRFLRQLLRAIEHIWWPAALILIAGTALIAIRIVPALKSELIPQFREGHFVVQASTTTAGTSLDEMVALGERISRKILELPYVATVEQQIGRAEAGEDTWNTHRSEFHIELKAGYDKDEEAAQDGIRDVLKAYPELATETLTFLGDRISESLTGKTAQAVINVSGDDLEDIEKVASTIRKGIADVPGIADAGAPEIANAPLISVELDPASLTAYGLNAQDALDTVQSAFAGATLGQTYSGNRTVGVVMILPPSSRNKLDALEHLMIGNAKTRVLLRHVAHIKIAEGRTAIEHEAGQRRAAVTFNAAGKPLSEVVAGVRDRIKALTLPKGLYVAVTGQAEEERLGLIRFAMLTGIAVLLIVLTLALAFHRRGLAVFVLANVPFCLAGSLAAIYASNVGLTLGSIVGLITVFGIAARNSIMLIAHVEHLIDVEHYPWSRRIPHRAAMERVLPIVLTAVMTALGLVPLALGLGRSGYEIEAPMALAVLGGLAAATVLNILLMPGLLTRLWPQPRS